MITQAIIASENGRQLQRTPVNTFADFLFELQLVSGIGVDNHGYNAAIFSMDGIINDYKPFYKNLSLDGIIAYEDFCDIARAEKSPPPNLIQFLQVLLSSNSAIAYWLNTLKKLPDAGHYCLNNGDRSYLSEYLRQFLCRDDEFLYTLAEYAGIYPSQLEAIVSDSVIASQEIRNKLYKYCRLNKQFSDSIDAQYNRFKDHLFSEDTTKAHLMELVGAITKHGRIPEFLTNILNLNNGINRKFFGNIVSRESLEAILFDRKSPARQKMRRTYSAKIIKALAKALPIEKNAKRVFLDLGLNRPFETILEEYVLSGSTDWSNFLYRLGHEWNMTKKELAPALGISLNTFKNWSGPKKDIPTSLHVEHLVERFSLDGFQKDYLFALSRGDLLIGNTFAKIVADMQAQMLAKPIVKRAIFANSVLKNLIDRSGRFPADIAREAGCTDKFIKNRMSATNGCPPTGIPNLHNIALALAPMGASKKMKRDTQLLLVGLPENRTPSQLLQLVEANRITTGEMIQEHRKQFGVNAKNFAIAIGAPSLMGFAKYESTPGPKVSVAVLKKITRHMNLSEAESNIFVRRAVGLNGVDHNELNDLLSLAVSADQKKHFSDVMQYVVQTTFALESNPRSGIPELAKELRCLTQRVTKWYEGKAYISNKELATNFAAVAKIPKNLIRDFVAVAMDKVPQYDSTALNECDPQDIDSRRKLWKSFIENSKLTYADLAAQLGVSRDTLNNAVKTGYWEAQKASIEDVAEQVIPENFMCDRVRFCEILSRVGF